MQPVSVFSIHLHRHQKEAVALWCKGESWAKSYWIHRKKVVIAHGNVNIFLSKPRHVISVHLISLTLIHQLLYVIGRQVLEVPDLPRTLQASQNQHRKTWSRLKWRWLISRSWLVVPWAELVLLLFRRSAGVQLKHKHQHLPGGWAHWNVSCDVVQFAVNASLMNFVLL